MPSVGDDLNRTYDLEESMFADETTKPPFTSLGSPQMSEEQVQLASIVEDQTRKSPKVSRSFAPPFPVSPSPLSNMAKIRAKSPWSDHVAARKRLLGKWLSSQGSKRTIPPPFPVTSTLSQELRLMMRESHTETETKQDLGSNCATTSVCRTPTPWGKYLRKEGLKSCQSSHAERLTQRRNREDEQASCSG
ncbi:hypothetical protein TcWFU_002118 [Taenia crassiceps]|uniref:Uncharacterized protein n=1 Tax=Taenia crassiceps TaxID=6207 RepID=A0ABR4Q823_9CEST